MNNKKILITGATGNVGFQTIRFLYKSGTSNQVIAGVRDINKARNILKEYPQLQYVEFDFEDPSTFEHSLHGIDSVFLLRPPHISNIEKFFKPLIDIIKKKNIREIIFLSVQGAEKSKVIPHNKIERLIAATGIDYIYLRPGYFMQNLTTTLIQEIREHRIITLPAGKCKFNWIDIENIGELGAIVLENFSEYKNRAIEVTGYENESFFTVENQINKITDRPIKYIPVNLIKFYSLKKRAGMSTGMIIVMAMLHYLPRFQKEPRISNFYEQVTGKAPTKLAEFIEREKNHFQ